MGHMSNTTTTTRDKDVNMKIKKGEEEAGMTKMNK
jgi:hypothetical protein